MTRPFRFAIQALAFSEADEVRAFARQVEDLGYAELYSYDHIGAPDPFLPLVLAAEATTTLRLGTLVLNNEFHNPVLLARAAATLDRLSGGRLVLGMGTGYMQWEHDASAIPLRPPGRRVTRFGESLAILRSLLDTGAAKLAGDEASAAVEDLGVRPVQARVPFLVGGHGRRVVGLAARHADIFQFTGLTHEPGTGMPGPGGFARAEIETRRRWLEEAAAERLGEIDLSALVQITHVGDDAGAVAESAAANLGGDPELLAGTPFALIGSKSQVIDKLHALREELRIHHFVVRDAPGFAPIVAALAGT